MARAHAASACVQSDSIKGLAQSIAKPAYRRLLVAEPALRRAVPTLIIAFLITICLGAFVQVVDQNRQKRASIKRDLAALADLLAERLDHIASVRQDRAATFERLQLLLPGLVPSWAIAAGRHVIVEKPLEINEDHALSFAEAVDKEGQALKRGDKLLVWGGPTQLCTRDVRFEISEQKNCGAQGLTSTGFAVIDMAGKQGATVRFRE